MSLINHCTACGDKTFPSYYDKHLCCKCYRIVQECRWCGYKKDFKGLCPKCNLSGHKWSARRAADHYGSPCLICKEIPVFRSNKSDPCVCISCRKDLEQDFNDRKANREDRIRLRGVRKQMGELTLLIREARELLK